MSPGSAPEQPRAPRHRADWYPDPTRRFEFRYHNGQDWTGDVATDGRRFLDALPRLASGSVVMPSPMGATTGATTGVTPGGEPRRSPKATAALVLGIASVATGWVPFVFVLAAVAAVLALVFGLTVLARVRRDASAVAGVPNAGHTDRNFARAATILAPIGLCVCVLGGYLSVLAYREVDRFSNVGAHTIEETSCVVDGTNEQVAMMTGQITNDSDSARAYRITVEFLRPGTNNVLYTASTDVGVVAPGDRERWAVQVEVSHAELECRVDQVTGPLPFNQS